MVFVCCIMLDFLELFMGDIGYNVLILLEVYSFINNVQAFIEAKGEWYKPITYGQAFIGAR